MTSIAVSPKGRLIACGTMDGQILLVDSKSGKSKRGITGHEGAVAAVSFAGKQSSIISCSRDRTTRLWNTMSRDEPIVLRHSSEVKAMTTSVLSGKGASGARDGEVKVFSLGSLKCIKNLQAHRSDISGILFLEEEKTMVTSSYNGECRVWDLSTYESVKTLAKKGPRIRSIASTPDGSFVFLGFHSGSILKISMEDAKDKIEIGGHSDIVSTMSVDPSGKFLASGSWDRTLRIWSLDDFQEVASGKLVTGISSLAWSTKENIVFSTDFSGSIVSWSL